MLRGAYENQREQVKRDLNSQGKEQAKQDAQLAKEKVQEQAEGDTVTAPYQDREPVGVEYGGDLDSSGASQTPPEKRTL